MSTIFQYFKRYYITAQMTLMKSVKLEHPYPPPPPDMYMVKSALVTY